MLRKVRLNTSNPLGSIVNSLRTLSCITTVAFVTSPIKLLSYDKNHTCSYMVCNLLRRTYPSTLPFTLIFAIFEPIKRSIIIFVKINWTHVTAGCDTLTGIEVKLNVVSLNHASTWVISFLASVISWEMSVSFASKNKISSLQNMLNFTKNTYIGNLFPPMGQY